MEYTPAKLSEPLIGRLAEPLTQEQMKAMKDEDGYITGIVSVDLSDIIDNNFEGFLDMTSEKLTGTKLLMDISYKAVGVDKGGLTLFVEVTGDPSEILGAKEE